MSRLDRAATFAAIARLIVDSNLPAPSSIRLMDDARGTWAHLTLDSFEDAAVWGAHLGVTRPAEDTYQPEGREGQIHRYTAYAKPALGLHTVGLSGWTAVDEPEDGSR